MRLAASVRSTIRFDTAIPYVVSFRSWSRSPRASRASGPSHRAARSVDWCSSTRLEGAGCPADLPAPSLEPKANLTPCLPWPRTIRAGDCDRPPLTLPFSSSPSPFSAREAVPRHPSSSHSSNAVQTRAASRCVAARRFPTASPRLRSSGWLDEPGRTAHPTGDSDSATSTSVSHLDRRLARDPVPPGVKPFAPSATPLRIDFLPAG